MVSFKTKGNISRVNAGEGKIRDMIKITDENIFKAFRDLQAEVRHDAEVLEYEIWLVKRLRISNTDRKWDRRLYDLRRDIKRYDMIRLFIKFRGSRSMSSFSNLNNLESDLEYTDTMTLDIIARLDYLACSNENDRYRFLYGLEEHNSYDRYLRDSYLTSWPPQKSEADRRIRVLWETRTYKAFKQWKES